MVNRRIDRRHEKLSRRPWARSSALRRRVHRWNPGRGLRGELAGAPEEPYRMLGPDIDSGVGAKGADWRRPRAHERAWQSGRRGLGQNIDRAKGNQRERSGARRLGRARMVQNTDARVARDYADAGRRRYHSVVIAGEGADAGY